jgi:hypothetical protein
MSDVPDIAAKAHSVPGVADARLPGSVKQEDGQSTTETTLPTAIAAAHITNENDLRLVADAALNHPAEAIEATPATQEPAEETRHLTILSAFEPAPSHASHSAFLPPGLPASAAFIEPDRRDSGNQDDKPQDKRLKLSLSWQQIESVRQLGYPTRFVRGGTPIHFQPDHPKHGTTTYQPATRDLVCAWRQRKDPLPYGETWNFRLEAKYVLPSSISRAVATAQQDVNPSLYMKDLFWDAESTFQGRRARHFHEVMKRDRKYCGPRRKLYYSRRVCASVGINESSY